MSYVTLIHAGHNQRISGSGANLVPNNFAPRTLLA